MLYIVHQPHPLSSHMESCHTHYLASVPTMAAAPARVLSSGQPGADAVAKAKRNDLSLKLQYEVIKTVEKEPKIGVRKLAELFHCGKTQISSILKNKEMIVELYEIHNAPGRKCHKRNRESIYSDL